MKEYKVWKDARSWLFVKACVLIFLCFLGLQTIAQNKKNKAIYSGIPWFDDKGNTVSAHGACIIKDKDQFYLFGEAHDDSTNAFAGFNCYSSIDLYNWKFESIALTVQDSGKLSANTVGERPKVMKCPGTGEYIMYMLADNMQYKEQYVGYATANSITGPYTFKGPLLFNGKMIKKWDMGTFQDDDGNGYILLHGADIYKLNNDYKSIAEQTHKATEKGFEAPTLFKKDSVYYFIGSDLTGWERNDNYYLTATSLKGPWLKTGYLTPKETLTWNSQTTFVLPIQGSATTTYMFMGDRWSFPKQKSAATYVWQPLTIDGYNLSIPNYLAAWKINVATGVVSSSILKANMISLEDNKISFKGNWQHDSLGVQSSNEKGAFFSLTVKGNQFGVHALSQPNGGYALITIKNKKGKVVVSSAVDMYCKYAVKELKFLTPVLPKATYTITVEVLGEHWYWKEKSGRLSGSLGNIVAIDKLLIGE